MKRLRWLALAGVLAVLAVSYMTSGVIVIDLGATLQCLAMFALDAGIALELGILGTAWLLRRGGMRAERIVRGLAYGVIAQAGETPGMNRIERLLFEAMIGIIKIVVLLSKGTD